MTLTSRGERMEGPKRHESSLVHHLRPNCTHTHRRPRKKEINKNAKPKKEKRKKIFSSVRQRRKTR